MTHTAHRLNIKSDSSRTVRNWLKLWLVISAYPVQVYAQLQLNPYTSAQDEYNSNVFAISSPAQAVVETGDVRRDDWIQRYLAGANARYQTGAQVLYSTIEGRRLDYDHFTLLNHNEYLLNGGLDWIVRNGFDGNVDIRQERSMAPFADRTTAQLVLETDRLAQATASLKITPDWQLQGGLKDHRLDSPIDGFPTFGLAEHSANLAANYLALGNFKAGIYGEYLYGDYRGLNSPSKFSQESLEATSGYDLGDVLKVNAKLGYTERKDQQDGAGTVSGYTGSLSYVHVLSVKTSLDGGVFRNISSYSAGSNSMLDTGATAGFHWRPSYKIALDAGYRWTNSEFKGSQAGAVDSGRRDKASLSNLTLSYQALQWLRVQLFTSYENRESNIDIDAYNAFTAGIDLRMTFGTQTATLPGKH